jgi:hypothetical protein
MKTEKVNIKDLYMTDFLDMLQVLRDEGYHKLADRIYNKKSNGKILTLKNKLEKELSEIEKISIEDIEDEDEREELNAMFWMRKGKIELLEELLK